LVIKKNRLRTIEAEILKKLRTASLNLEFTGLIRTSYVGQFGKKFSKCLSCYILVISESIL